VKSRPVLKKGGGGKRKIMILHTPLPILSSLNSYVEKTKKRVAPVRKKKKRVTDVRMRGEKRKKKKKRTIGRYAEEKKKKRKDKGNP